MITKEDIKKTAIDNITISEELDLRETIKEIACESFIVGANWRINTVWHDVSERPVSMKECLVELDDPMRKGWHIGRIENEGTNKGKWNIYGYFTPSLHECIIRWAYLSDFLPNKED